ncbi:hypothetical protein QQ045_008678 [Rhodiola kirilowii]
MKSVNYFSLTVYGCSCTFFCLVSHILVYIYFGQISAIKKSISSGNKVPEVQITTLIELLMRQAIKLDSVPTVGTELSAAKNLQGKRVQKSVETLDLLKVENAKVKPVIISTKWETFEFDPPPTTAARWELFD